MTACSESLVSPVLAAASIRSARHARRRVLAGRIMRRISHQHPSTAHHHRAGTRDLTAAGILGVALAGVGLPVPAVVLTGLVIAVAIRVALPRQASRRRRRRTSEQLPDALDAMAASLRRGASLIAALDAAGAGAPEPIGPRLRSVAIDARHRGVARALESLDRSGDPLAPLGLPLATAVRADADPTGVVSGIARSLRAELDLVGEVDAMVTQARLSGAVMSLTPLGFAALLTLGDPGAREFLLTTRVGIACLVIGLALDAVGWAWMQAIARQARR